MSYDKAKEYAHGLELASWSEWHKWTIENWANRDKMCLPVNPDKVYPKEWENWFSFLEKQDAE